MPRHSTRHQMIFKGPQRCANNGRIEYNNTVKVIWLRFGGHKTPCHDDPLDDPRSCCLVKEFVQGDKNLEAPVRSLEDDKSFFEFLDSCLVHSWGQKALLCECWYHAAVS